MAADPDDIRGLIHSQGARIPHLPRSAAALSRQITALFQRLYRWTLSLAESRRAPWHGASIAIATFNGIFRSSVLERWAGVKRILLLAKQEEPPLQSTSHPFLHEIRLWHRGKPVGEFLGWFLKRLDLCPSDIDLAVVSDSQFATCGLRLGPRLGEWFPKAWISHLITHYEIHQRQAFWQSG